MELSVCEQDEGEETERGRWTESLGSDREEEEEEDANGESSEESSVSLSCSLEKKCFQTLHLPAHSAPSTNHRQDTHRHTHKRTHRVAMVTASLCLCWKVRLQTQPVY